MAFSDLSQGSSNKCDTVMNHDKQVEYYKVDDTSRL
jgi:hypothetical protein